MLRPIWVESTNIILASLLEPSWTLIGIGIWTKFQDQFGIGIKIGIKYLFRIIWYFSFFAVGTFYIPNHPFIDSYCAFSFIKWQSH
jgi:hypothetical protein